MNRKLLRLLHEVRYREITELIGKEIVISTFSSIRQELTDAVHALIPLNGQLELTSKNLSGTLAKYAILDLKFATSQQVLSEPDKLSRKALTDLGFLVSKKDEKAARELEDRDPTCIESLVEGLPEEKEWLLVFLELDPRGDPFMERFHARQRAIEAGVAPEEAYDVCLQEAVEALPTRFPAKFKIIDACITNSDFIWFHKHFYL